MKIRIWGCRGSIPRAHPDMLRYGGNTPCIEVTSNSGHIVVLDLGSGAFDLGVDLMKRMKQSDENMHGTVLITHTHWDHIQGFPFFAPLFSPGFAWNVYGPRGLAGSFEDTLSGQMQYEYFPVTISQLGAKVNYHDLLEGALQVEGVRVKTHYLNHTVLTLGYLLESGGVSVAYITDHEPFDHRLAVEGYQQSEKDATKTDDDRHVDFFAGVDLLIHDCQYTAKEYGQGKAGWGHSTVEFVVDIAIAAGVKQLALFHHDPNRKDDQVDEMVEIARERAAFAAEGKEGVSIPEIYAAAEGMTIDLIEQSVQLSAQKCESSNNGAHLGVNPLSAIFAQRKGKNIDGKTVVVGLDCSSEFTDVLTKDLERDKLNVETCIDFDSLLRVSNDIKPSVIVMNQTVPGGRAIDICASIREMGEWGRNVSFLVVAKNQKEMEKCRAESNINADDWITEPLSAAYIRTRIRMSLLRSPCRWKRAPIPINEDARLAALYDSCMLDVDHSDSLTRIGRIATQLFDCAAFCSLLDKDRVKFISGEGMKCQDVARDAAMCAHVVHNNDILVVNDALEDDRFADNPLVKGAPFLRFYAGFPITVEAADGISYPIGSICLMDQKPRRFDVQQIKILQDLAAMSKEEFVIISKEAQEKRLGNLQN